MVFVNKIIGKVLVNKNGEIFENKKEGLAALEQSEAHYVDYLDLIIYSEYDFKDCFKHHVKGIARKDRPNDIYTVLAPADESEITEEGFKIIYEAILKSVDVQSEQKGPVKIYKIEFKFNPDEYKGYKFQNNNCPNFDDSRPIKLLCGDMRIVTPKEFPKQFRVYLLSEKEVKDIISYYTASLLPTTAYKIRTLWVIGHSDLRSNWN